MNDLLFALVPRPGAATCVTQKRAQGNACTLSVNAGATPGHPEGRKKRSDTDKEGELPPRGSPPGRPQLEHPARRPFTECLREAAWEEHRLKQRVKTEERHSPTRLLQSPVSLWPRTVPWHMHSFSYWAAFPSPSGQVLGEVSLTRKAL